MSQSCVIYEKFHSDHFNPEMNARQLFWEAVAFRRIGADPWTALRQWFK